MKIGLYTFQYPGELPFGGAGVYSAELAAGLVRAGHVVHVFTHDYVDRPMEVDRGVHVHRVRVPDRPFLRSAMFKRRLAPVVLAVDREIGGFDVLHTNEQYVLEGFVCPTVMTVHHVLAVLHRSFRLPALRGDRNPWILRAERRSVGRADRIVTVSPQSAKDLVRYYPHVAERTTPILNGVDVDAFHAADGDLSDCRRRLGLRDGQKLIVSSPGNVEDERKGLRYMLEGFATFPADLDWKCVILGRGSRAVYDEWLSDPRVGSRVEFPGFVDRDHKIDLLLAADVFAMPSLLEGCPTAMLEALAARCAVVGTRVGGIPDLIRSDDQGRVVEARDSGAFASALIELLRDEATCRRLAANNRRLALDELTWDATARATAEVYREAIAGRTVTVPR